MAASEITVRGAGIFGLSVAYACQSRGARVRVIDPGGPGAGASGGVVGALAPHVPENWNAKKQFQFEALAMAGDYWAEVDALSGGSSGYGRTGRLQPLADEAAVALARARADSARKLWQGRALWEVVEAPEGWAPPSATGLVVRDTLTARLHPARAVASLAGAIRARGGEILSEGADRGAVVWATGFSGLEALSREAGRLVGAGIKGQAAVLGFDAGPGAPQLFAEGLHIVPHDDGTVAIGSTSEREWDSAGETDEQLDAVIGKARHLCPALADAPVLARWAGVRPRAKSRAPLLGRWPGREGHYIANGGFKIGFGVAPRVGEVMAGLVCDGIDAIPPAFSTETALS